MVIVGGFQFVNHSLPNISSNDIENIMILLVPIDLTYEYFSVSGNLLG